MNGREQGLKESRRIPELDGLRGMAITAVLVYHYFEYFAPTVPGRAFLIFHASSQMGWCGVDLFFVLSGFLIGGILLDAKESPRYFQNFYQRRLRRIFPAYYLWIGAYFLLSFVPFLRLPAPLSIGPERWTIIPIFSLFAQNLIRTWHHGLGITWLGPLWSLAVEEQFYLVMPWMVRFLSKRWLVLLLLLAIVAAPVARIVAYQLSPTHTVQYTLTPCRVDAIAIGVLLALVWRDQRWRARLLTHQKSLYALVGLSLITVGYFGIWHPSPYSYAMSLWGLSCVGVFFACLLLLALVAHDGIWAGFCRWNFWRDIGGVSYCMYLIHLAVADILHAAFHSSNGQISTSFFFTITAFAAATTWAVAKISWRYLESPLLRRGQIDRISESSQGPLSLTANA